MRVAWVGAALLALLLIGSRKIEPVFFGPETKPEPEPEPEPAAAGFEAAEAGAYAAIEGCWTLNAEAEPVALACACDTFEALPDAAIDRLVRQARAELRAEEERFWLHFQNSRSGVCGSRRRRAS